MNLELEISRQIAALDALTRGIQVFPGLTNVPWMLGAGSIFSNISSGTLQISGDARGPYYGAYLELHSKDEPVSPGQADVIVGNSNAENFRVYSFDWISSWIRRFSIKGTGSMVFGGTAFPANPAAGDIFYRTDLHWWCEYTGSLWLTCQDYQACHLYVAAGMTSAYELIVANRADYAPYIMRVVAHGVVSATNNATNYWDIIFRGVNSAFGAASNIHVTSTAGMTAGTWATLVDGIPNTSQAPANYNSLSVLTGKHNAPGTLTMTFTTYYRLIVT